MPGTAKRAVIVVRTLLLFLTEISASWVKKYGKAMRANAFSKLLLGPKQYELGVFLNISLKCVSLGKSHKWTKRHRYTIAIDTPLGWLHCLPRATWLV